MRHSAHRFCSQQRDPGCKHCSNLASFELFLNQNTGYIFLRAKAISDVLDIELVINHILQAAVQNVNKASACIALYKPLLKRLVKILNLEA